MHTLLRSTLRYKGETFGTILLLGTTSAKTTVHFLVRFEPEKFGRPYITQALAWVFSRITGLVDGDVHAALVTRKLESPLRKPKSFLQATARKLSRAIWESRTLWKLEREGEEEPDLETVPVECDQCSWGTFAASKEDFLENRNKYQAMHDEARPSCTGMVELGLF